MTFRNCALLPTIFMYWCFLKSILKLNKKGGDLWNETAEKEITVYVCYLQFGKQQFPTNTRSSSVFDGRRWLWGSKMDFREILASEWVALLPLRTGSCQIKAVQPVQPVCPYETWTGPAKLKQNTDTKRARYCLMHFIAKQIFETLVCLFIGIFMRAGSLIKNVQISKEKNMHSAL